MCYDESMKQQNKQSTEYVDTLTKDFHLAVVIVSLMVNVAVFVSWLTYTVIAVA